MKKTILKHLPTFLGFFSYYAMVSLFLFFQWGVASKEAIFLVEKGIVALHGMPPHLENIGLVYPPLPFVANLPFAAFTLIWGPQITTSLAGALLATIAFAEFKSVTENRLLRGTFMGLLLIHPLFLYVVTMGGSAILFSLALFSYMYLLLRYSFLGKTFNLVSAGLLAGLMAFLKYETLLFFLFATPVIHLVGGGLKFRTGWGVVSLLLMNLVPPIMAWLAWAYLNWLFTGDWLNFLRSPYAYFRNVELYGLYNIEALQARNDVIKSLWAVARRAVFVLPPFFLALAFVRNFALSWFFLCPLMALAFAAFSGLSLFALDDFVVLLPLTPLLLAVDRTLTQGWQKYILVAFFILSIPGSVLVLSKSNIDEEQQFGNMFLGKKPKEQFSNERAMAQFILSNFDSQQRILLDDANGYPIVVFSREPRRFVLPYQYEFRSAVISPGAFVNAFLVADPRRVEGRSDNLNQFHKDVFQYGLAGATLVREFPPWRLYVFDGMQNRASRIAPLEGGLGESP